MDIVEDAARDLVNSVLSDLYKSAKEFVSNRTFQIEAAFSKPFQEYYRRTLETAIQTKTFLSIDYPQNFYDVYTEIPISNEATRLPNPNSESIFRVSRYVCLMGSAGSGKSLLMRHLLLDALLRKKRVPIFAELRRCDVNVSCLEELLIENLERFNFSVPINFLHSIAEAGELIILFDGLDELSVDGQRIFADRIREFVEKYPRNRIIISSRPDRDVRAWRYFENFFIDDLDVDLAEDVVSKMPSKFNDRKDSFIQKIRGNYFEEYEYFTKNPLLLSILFVTQGRSGNLNSKPSVFYNHAFEALVDLHDTVQKPGFERQTASGIDADDFQRVFSAFSVLSYIKHEKVQFSRKEAVDIAGEAKALISKKFLNIDFEAEDFIYDAHKNFCLLVDDDSVLEYPHRTFQEYYSARYLSGAKEEEKEGIISRIVDELYVSDLFFRVISEIDPKTYENYVFIPVVESIIEVSGVRKKFGITHHRKVWKKIFPHLKLGSDVAEWNSDKEVLRLGRMFQIVLKIENGISHNNKPVIERLLVENGSGRMILNDVRSGEASMKRSGVDGLFTDSYSITSERKMQKLIDKYYLIKRKESEMSAEDILFGI